MSNKVWTEIIYPFPNFEGLQCWHLVMGKFLLHSTITPWPFRLRGIVVACVCQSVHRSVRLSVCPKTFPCPHNSSHIWAGITKFAPNMHSGILSAGGHWPWPSRSFWPFWLRILGNLACPHDNSSQVQTRITKIRTKHASWDTLGWYMKIEVIDHDLQGHLCHFDREF